MSRAESAAVRVLEEVDAGWAWAPWEPSADAPWNLQRAAHLYRRAAFGASWARLEEAVAAGWRQTVDQIVEGPGEAESFYEDARRLMATLWASGSRAELPAWWLHVMLRTPYPLLEKMTLFWHGHFATSAAKVTDLRMMYRQNELFRQLGLGRFGPLLSAAAKDPAMLVWLDSAANRKAHPNENFAREVMELFALGIGNYTEQDIKEAARSFTGWELRGGAFRNNRYQHDDGEKSILGRRGNFDGDDVIEILLEQPAAARLLVGKLFGYFVSEAAVAPAALVDPLADELRRRDYDVGWLVRTILSSNLFYSPLALGQKIKTPIELALGLIHALEGTTNCYALAEDLGELGQAVFYPPNVKGWNGGADWINSATLVGRANLVWALVGGGDARYGSKLPIGRLQALEGVRTGGELVRRLLEVLIAVEVPEAVVVNLTALAADGKAGSEQKGTAALIHAIATLPEFQLA